MEPYLTIYVIFEGLGFCCFDPKKQRADIAFLRLPKHDLTIKISGTDGRHEVYENIALDSHIELTSEGTAVKGFQLNNDGDFDRKSDLDFGNDQFDLRWMVDFQSNELHSRTARPQPANSSPEEKGGVQGLTRMFLPNAFFYTEHILVPEYVIEEKNDGNPDSENILFGRLGSALAARIDATKASLQIKGREPFQFEKVANPKHQTRFIVSITNDCDDPPTTAQSDFYKYYEVLDFQDGKKFDFKPRLSTRGGYPVMCEFTWLSQTENLDAFFTNIT